MKKARIILIGLIVILLSILVYISVNVSNRQKPYKELENEIVNAMKVYYGQDTNLKKLPQNKKTHKVTLEELKTFGININNIINNDNCDGYGIVTGELVSHKYESFIKCNKYTSKNYKK